MRESSLTSRERLQRESELNPPGTLNSGDLANLVVIGASAGGHRALVDILKTFSADMPAAIVILLHLPMATPPRLKEFLGRFSLLPIIEVENQEPLRQGFIFIPLPGRSATFSRGMITVENPNRDKPLSTINRLFISAAQTYTERVIGVILSGLLSDGTDGLRAVHDAGGLTMVQDPREAEYPDMPANAMEGLDVTFCLNLAEIGPALDLLVRRTARFETGLEVALRTLRDRAALLARLNEQSWRNSGTREFLKNELVSLRHDIQSIDEFLKASAPDEK